ncbi:GIY-YIG nuclease family protein [Variovorax sp. LT1P1]|uniref:GIY-YIG nuclease family protein n=1 Tax=Variovorax sp. LT1P1 TaxID=3443730 RepID=UPI003F48281D
MTSTIQNSGGVLARILRAIDGFHRQHGIFPDVIEAPQALIDDALGYCLTPHGSELLRKRVQLRPGANNQVIAFGGAASYEYGDSSIGENPPAVARGWIGLDSEPDWPTQAKAVLPLKPLEASSQIVYVLTNPAMPGLVKVGKTTQMEVELRMKQLFGTGVPVPFDCAFACQVKDAHEVEKALHFAFGNARINPNREFFKIEPERVIAVLRLLEVNDVTLQVEQQIESEVTTADKQSAQKMKDRRPNLRFFELGIPEGSSLLYREGGAQAIVVEDRKVSYLGEVQSLTSATRKVQGLADDYALQPSPYWTFNGSTLKQLYEAFHAADPE